MSVMDEIRAERLKKVELLRAAGMDPYPAHVARTHTLHEALAQFEALEKETAIVSVVGRAMSVRGQGGILFVDLFDGTDKMQTLIKKDDMGDEKFDLFVATVDASDFIEVTGTVLVTKRGEKSVGAKSWRMLAKSLRPVPEAWFGLKDEDERYRKRYLDLLLNTDVADTVKKRSIFWNSVRSFMLKREYIEVETPVLETLTGGAEARPFITHHNALDIDVYLRISAGELWQKKLLVAGIPKTFEIGRIFRNEGISPEHAQDYTMFEFYSAYEDATTGIPLLKDLYRTVAQETFGKTLFSIRGFEIDFAKEWESLDYNILMQKEFGLDPRTATLPDAQRELKKHSIFFEESADLGRCIDLLWKRVRKNIAGPAILTGMPLYLEPLAKKSVADPRTVDRFQILIAGSELGKAFNELNDPLDQRERFAAQQALRDKGDDEAQMADYEFVEAMEYGMPPAFGFGVSERLFSFLIDKPIREAQLFPLMRPKEEIVKKAKETKVAVAVINTLGLEPWQIINTAAHLSAELGVRGGRDLLRQDSIETSDGVQIPLNIQHAIMIKVSHDGVALKNLLKEGKNDGVQVAAFTREMLATTNDKKIADATATQALSDVEFLGVLVFGEKSAIEALTLDFPLYA